MIVGTDEMVENVIENKSKKMINIDVNLRNNWSKFKKHSTLVLWFLIYFIDQQAWLKEDVRLQILIYNK